MALDSNIRVTKDFTFDMAHAYMGMMGRVRTFMGTRII